MRHILQLLVLLAHLFSPHTTPYERMVDRVSSSVVHILGEKEDTGAEPQHYVCSGFVISRNRVLTASHCLGEHMSVDGAYPTVLKMDEYYDLALLSVPSDKSALDFSTQPLVRFQTLSALGWAFGWTKLTVMEERLLLIDHTVTPSRAPGLILQHGFIGGMSGGPIVDSDGQVVGIVQESNEGVGYGVGIVIIRAFLLGVD